MPPVEPPANKASATPRRADLIEVGKAEVGVWDRVGGFRATEDVPLIEGQTFGWRLYLPCSTPRVAYQEELVLPAPGDWGTDPDMRISYDGTTVTVRSTIGCSDGWIEKQWSVAGGDPAGIWSIRITASGYEPQAFRVTFAAPLVP